MNASAIRPSMRPCSPNFSSGPCAKRPGWSVAALAGALLGRSHRAKHPKARLAEVLSSLDLRDLPEADQKFLAANEDPALRTVPQVDGAFDQIRDLVTTLKVDLSKL